MEISQHRDGERLSKSPGAANELNICCLRLKLGDIFRPVEVCQSRLANSLKSDVLKGNSSSSPDTTSVELDGVVELRRDTTRGIRAWRRGIRAWQRGRRGAKRSVGLVGTAQRLHRLICRLPIVGIANEWSSESGCKRDEV